MSGHLLMVMNPRTMEECVRSLSGLEVDKAWLTGYTESQLRVVVASLVGDTAYDRYTMVSDDVVVTPRALEVVADQGSQYPECVVTGWTNLDMTDRGLRLASVTDRPFTAYESVAEQYHWTPMRDVVCGDAVRRTWFAGMCLTSMSREQWLRFPFGTYHGGGCCSDFDLSWRLQEAGVPVFALRDAGVFHVKEVTGVPEAVDPRRALRIADEPQVRREYERCPTCGGRGWHTAGGNDPTACGRCPAGEAWAT